MDRNIYSAPQAELVSGLEQTNVSKQFYVVSLPKFYLLMIGTGGVYILYWFYRQWEAIKEAKQLDVWPVARAIFSIIFIHSLARHAQPAVPEKRRGQVLNLFWLATIYVGTTVITAVLNYLWQKNGQVSLSIALTVISMFIEYGCIGFFQKHINIAANDVDGQSNANISVANCVWIAIGAVFWWINIKMWIDMLTVAGFLTA